MKLKRITFEEISEALSEGKPKVFIIDNGYFPYFLTGYVTKAYEDDGKRLDLDPAICIRAESSPYVGSFNPNESEVSFAKQLNMGKDTVFVTPKYLHHQIKARQIVKKVCGNESEFFWDYLRKSRDM